MWRIRGRHRTEGSGRGAVDRDGVDDCEAFLAGHYAEWLLQHRRPVPPWAWLNQAAHAPTIDVLFAAASPPSMTTSPWTATRRAMAVELLHAVRDLDELETIRREVLVPLELDLARSILDPPLTPGQLLALVRTTIDTHRRGLS